MRRRSGPGRCARLAHALLFAAVLPAGGARAADEEVGDASGDARSTEAPAETVEGLTDDENPDIERKAATDPGVEAIPEKASRSSNFQGRIRAEYSEVMAGPGAAYLGRGRVYQNDVVRIVRRNEGGDWLEIDGNGLRGWVRTRYVEITRTAVVKDAAGGVDAGRDRRETNYQYDRKGRRLRPDGRPVGTGEGAAATDEAAEASGETDEAAASESPAPESPTGASGEPTDLGLHPFAGVGVGQIRRVFDSNVEGDSTLKHQAAQPKGLALALGLDWDPLEYLRLGLRFEGVFFGSTDIPADAALGFAKPVTLAISGWQGGLDAMGRYPLGPAWVGAYGGLRLLRENYQKTKQYPLFLTNTLWSGVVGGAAGAAFPVGLELSARAGYALPVSLSQEPTDAGDLKSGSGYEVGAGIGWRVHPRVTATLDLFFVRSKLEFGGPSGQRQTFDETGPAAGKEPLGYDRARETDTMQGVTLGARGGF